MTKGNLDIARNKEKQSREKVKTETLRNDKAHHTISLTHDQTNELDEHTRKIDALLGILVEASVNEGSNIDPDHLCTVVWMIKDHFDKVKELTGLKEITGEA